MDDSDHARRTRQNIAVVLSLIVIALAGTLLFGNFLREVAIVKCATSGDTKGCLQRLIFKPRHETTAFRQAGEPT